MATEEKIKDKVLYVGKDNSIKKQPCVLKENTRYFSKNFSFFFCCFNNYVIIYKSYKFIYCTRIF